MWNQWIARLFGEDCTNICELSVTFGPIRTVFIRVHWIWVDGRSVAMSKYDMSKNQFSGRRIRRLAIYITDENRNCLQTHQQQHRQSTRIWHVHVHLLLTSRQMGNNGIRIKTLVRSFVCLPLMWHTKLKMLQRCTESTIFIPNTTYLLCFFFKIDVLYTRSHQSELVYLFNVCDEFWFSLRSLRISCAALLRHYWGKS